MTVQAHRERGCDDGPAVLVINIPFYWLSTKQYLLASFFLSALFTFVLTLMKLSSKSLDAFSGIPNDF